jgi:hypothetical protein
MATVAISARSHHDSGLSVDNSILYIDMEKNAKPFEYWTLV